MDIDKLPKVKTGRPYVSKGLLERMTQSPDSSKREWAVAEMQRCGYVTFTEWTPFNLTPNDNGRAFSPQDNWIFGDADCRISHASGLDDQSNKSPGPNFGPYGGFPPFEGPVVGFRKEVLGAPVREVPSCRRCTVFELTGDLSFADPAPIILPEKGWHNELVKACDNCYTGVTIHVESEDQLQSIRDMAKRLRRPDLVFKVWPGWSGYPENDEKGG